MTNELTLENIRSGAFPSDAHAVGFLLGEIERLRGNLSLAEEGLANYALEIKRLQGEYNAYRADGEPELRAANAEIMRLLCREQQLMDFVRSFISGGVNQDFKPWARELYQKLYSSHEPCEQRPSPPPSTSRYCVVCDRIKDDSGETFGWALCHCGSFRQPEKSQGASRDSDHCDYPDCEQHWTNVVAQARAILEPLADHDPAIRQWLRIPDLPKLSGASRDPSSAKDSCPVCGFNMDDHEATELQRCRDASSGKPCCLEDGGECDCQPADIARCLADGKRTGEQL